MMDYQLGFKIGGKGDTKCFHATKDNKSFCVKTIEIKKGDHLKRMKIEREREILGKLQHRNIIKYVDYRKMILGEREIHCIITDLEKMDLAQYLQAKDGRLKEKHCRRIMRQIFCAVEYMHDQLVVHHDIKLENIMINDVSQDVKLIDFGMSFQASSEEEIKYMDAVVGTPYYVPPEKFSMEVYDGRKADAWALGVLLYKLASGNFPFSPLANDLHELSSMVREDDFEIPEHFSKDLTTLVCSLLEKDPSKRMSVTEALQHPFMKRKSFIKLHKSQMLSPMPLQTALEEIKKNLKKEI